MRRTTTSRSWTARLSRQDGYRPQLDPLEPRLPPGDAWLSVLFSAALPRPDLTAFDSVLPTADTASMRQAIVYRGEFGDVGMVLVARNDGPEIPGVVVPWRDDSESVSVAVPVSLPSASTF